MKYLFFFFTLNLQFAFSQSVYISRYVYGNLTTDTQHRLDFFNPSEKAQNLGGYMVITRNYVFRFPEKTVIPAHSPLKMGKGIEKGMKNSLDFSKIKDFLVRFSVQKIEGDYVVLLDKEKKIIDAVYFCAQSKVRFLPDKGELITFQNEKVPFEIPTQGYPKWKAVNINPDPAIVMIYLNDNWQPSSKKKNLFPVTEYAKVEASYVSGIASLKWRTNFEEDCFLHEIERSKKGDNFVKIGEMQGKVDSKTSADYLFYDEKIEKNRTYYYRLKSTDKFDNVVCSEEIELITSELRKAFALCPMQSNAAELTVRFSSQIHQPVKMKLLDEQFRELAILFQGEAKANQQNLIQYTQKIPDGKYFLIADTPNYRIYQEFKMVEGKIEGSSDCMVE
ncbi:MAG: hypothetical protein ACKVOU_01425 [Cytophagales bacterium]